MDFEAAISLLKKYIDGNLPLLNSAWPKSRFRERSYARWAAFELLGRLMNESVRVPPWITGKAEVSPIDVAEAFIGELDHCFEGHESGDSGLIFRTALATVEDIWSLFLGLDYKKGESHV